MKQERMTQTGEQNTKIKGQGLDFAELREYRPGDDIRRMDWQVYARTMTPHTREYYDERQQTYWVGLDLTDGMFYGSAYAPAFKTKAQWAIEALAAISLMLQKLNMQLGVFVLRDHDEPLIFKPSASPVHMQRIQKQLMDAYAPMLKAVQVNQADPITANGYAQLEAFSRLVLKQESVILITDAGYLYPDQASAHEAILVLGEMAKRSHVSHLLVYDPLELYPADIPASVLQETSVSMCRSKRESACALLTPQDLETCQSDMTQWRDQQVRVLQTFGSVLTGDTSQSPSQLASAILQQKNRFLPEPDPASQSLSEQPYDG